MADSATVIESLKSRFDPDAAQGMDDIFQFNISDAENYYLVVQDGTMDVHQGEHDDPSVTLSTDSSTLKGVMNGDINGMQAFMSGKLKASGNLMLATKLTNLFPSR
ncbi:SCP2 sterol-binding domain-containing protein [Modicisalibacter luteus]|uniref:SCP2 sterol-binding domain-containing protein n=1 Tax=Modicisalibacter luteus TaxID=453962 RepID=A0ABV7M485_9GAMM|nr:SCP2 sterol-binding domain-containing protein [Halomonas lutea]